VCAGKKTALLQTLVLRRFVRFANVLFSALAFIIWFLFLVANGQFVFLFFYICGNYPGDIFGIG